MSKFKDLSELLAHFQIEKWDILLIGDGSGSATGPCGWGCLSIEKEGLKRTAWSGSLSEGTVNVAEYMAYIQPLIHFSRQQTKTASCKHVHIFTDSQVVATASPSFICGKFLADFLAFGLIVKTHWLPRETLQGNKLVDKISKYARADAKDAQYVEHALSIMGKKDIYEIEPS